MNLKTSSIAGKVFHNMFFRSSCYAISAYFISFFIERLIMFTVAVLLGLEIKLDYVDLKFVGGHNNWTRNNILLLSFLPYFIFAVLIVWLQVVNRERKTKSVYKRIFINWLTLFIAYRLIGMMPVHLFYNTKISYVFEWLFLGARIKFLIAIISMLVFFYFASHLLYRIMSLNGSLNKNLSLLGKPKLILASFVLPAAICCIIVVLYLLPGLPKEEIHSLIFIAIPVSLTFIIGLISIRIVYPSSYQSEENFLQGQDLIKVLALVLFIRIILGFGISVN
jgi:hypothetical protein